MKKVLASIVVLAMLGTVVPTVDSQEDKIVPQPLPLASDTNVFSIFGTLEKVDQTNFCSQTIGAMWGTTTGGDRLFATNNPADPCRATSEGEKPDRFQVLMTSGTQSFRAHVVPYMAEGTPLVEGEPIEVKFTLVVVPVNPTVTVSVGSIQPKVTLASGKTSLGTWDEAPAVGVDTLNGPDAGGQAYYLDYALSFAAPKALSEGVVNLTISVANSIGAESQELRRVATKVGFAIDDAHRGSITLPFSKDVEDFGAPADDGGDDGGDNDSGNETDTGGNETGNETLPENTTAPEPTNTTAPSNNTTTDAPDEQGFLPGFEVAAVISAALVAMAYVARERRRPPMTRRS